jgi:RNA-directed DNA polymerase
MAFFHWLKHGSGKTMEELAERVGISVADLEGATPNYRCFQIPKRSGGHRIIQAPDEALKALQRSLYHRLFKRLPVHPCVTGFRHGYSIASNASVHVGKAVVVRMDIQEFFPSTQARRLNRYFSIIGWNRTVATLLTRLCTLDGGLPQGAPTSPVLSNTMNYRMDARLTGLAASCGGVYTRYADDLTFSFEEDKHSHYGAVIRGVQVILEDEGYAAHKKKKLHVRRAHQRQEVTGLVVNEKLALPRQTRRWLRAVDHRLATGGNATLTSQQRAGWAALESMVAAQREANVESQFERLDLRPKATYRPRNPATGELL